MPTRHVTLGGREYAIRQPYSTTMADLLVMHASGAERATTMYVMVGRLCDALPTMIPGEPPGAYSERVAKAIGSGDMIGDYVKLTELFNELVADVVPMAPSADEVSAAQDFSTPPREHPSSGGSPSLATSSETP